MVMKYIYLENPGLKCFPSPVEETSLVAVVGGRDDVDEKCLWR